MGTNFYWRLTDVRSIETPTGDKIDLLYTDDPKAHIGKRSAAGLYCWDCGVTLCKGGNDAVHEGGLEDYDQTWYKACPRCGQERANEDGLKAGPVALELGFAKPRLERPTGVRGCSSFSWAQNPEAVGTVCRNRPNDPLIVDEYGREITGQEFIDMLRANCPVQFTDSMGAYFS